MAAQPANDSARHYLVTLRSVNPAYAGLAAALQELGDRLIARARGALALQQIDAARNWLNAAADLGITSPDAIAVRRDLDAAAAQQRFPGNVVGADELTLVKSVPAVYPRKAALSRTEGWVDLDFTVAANGMVEDIAVRDAQPAGTFDAAAVSALAQWRYQPVMRDGIAATQRARIRMRFALSD